MVHWWNLEDGFLDIKFILFALLEGLLGKGRVHILNVV